MKFILKNLLCKYSYPYPVSQVSISLRASVSDLSNAIYWYILASKPQNDQLFGLVIVKNLQLSYSAIINL